MTPAVSVLIPAYHAENFIVRAVRSVLTQTLQNFEIIIASDDEQDYARILAAQGVQDVRMRYTDSGGVGYGPAVARNAALALAQGEVVAALDADDAFDPRYLEVMTPLAAKHGASCSANRYIDHITGEELADCNLAMPEGMVRLDTLLTSKIQTFANLCFSREKIEFGWPQHVERWEDVTLFALCCDTLGEMYWVPEKLYHYYRRMGSICNSNSTAKEFIYWCAQIESMILKGKLLFREQETRDIFLAYLWCRQAIEGKYQQGLAEGKHATYLEFLDRNRPLFHTLDVQKIADYSPR